MAPAAYEVEDGIVWHQRGREALGPLMAPFPSVGNARVEEEEEGQSSVVGGVFVLAGTHWKPRGCPNEVRMAGRKGVFKGKTVCGSRPRVDVWGRMLPHSR